MYITIKPMVDCNNGTLHSHYCPHASELMEHCYTCFVDTDQEVVVCDGWSLQQISEYCDSGVPVLDVSP